jgi:hypothetical protein
MAIRRCPYCKAIIDEQDKYCDNCGTQLLFPEDEFVDEPIPGDKIIDGESGEKDERKEELEDEGEEEEKKKEAEEEIEDAEYGEEEEIEDAEYGEEEEIEEEEEEEEDEEKSEEEIKKFAGSEKEEEEADEEELEFAGEEKGEFLEPQQEEGEEGLKERTPTGEIIEEEAEKEDRELQAWIELKEEIAKKAHGEAKEAEQQESIKGVRQEARAKIQVPDKKYEVSIKEDELVFKTKELDELTQAVEDGKKELEQFLASFEEKKEKKDEKLGSDTKVELPPWASGIKEAPPSLTPDQEERAEEEQRTTSQEWATDSGIGIPEKVTQSTLPFTGPVVRKEEQKEQREKEQMKEAAGEAETEPPRGFSLKLKAKCVDLIFITALWLISLAFAAGVIGVSFFKIIFLAPLPVFAFFLILLLLYFFLFLYFLGETLGDHYFFEGD